MDGVFRDLCRQSPPKGDESMFGPQAVSGHKRSSAGGFEASEAPVQRVDVRAKSVGSFDKARGARRHLEPPESVGTPEAAERRRERGSGNRAGASGFGPRCSSACSRSRSPRGESRCATWRRVERSMSYGGSGCFGDVQLADRTGLFWRRANEFAHRDAKVFGEACSVLSEVFDSLGQEGKQAEMVLLGSGDSFSRP